MSKAKEQKQSNTVYRVPKDKGLIDFVSPEEAIKDIVAYQVYDEEGAGNQLEAGETVASEKYVYARNADALKEYEEVPEGSESLLVNEKPLEVGDTVIDDTGRTGVVFIDQAKGQMKVMIDGKNKSVKVTDVWTRYTPDPEALALAQADAVLVEPMTEEEKTRLSELEEAVNKAKEGLQQALFSFPMKMGEGLSEISERKLYREFYGTFEEYAYDKFNISRSHAHRLIATFKFGAIAQDTLADVQETLQLSDGLQLSIRATEQLSKGASAIAEEIGLDKEEFNLMRPVIDNTIRTLVDTAPKDRQGKLSLTPNVISKFNEVLTDVIKTNTVEIDGQAMTLEEAKEKGVLAAGFQEQVVTSVVENIKAQKQFIIDEAKKAYERQTSASQPLVELPELPAYKGKIIPEFSGICSKHGEAEIIVIGNGTIQTSCQCRFRSDAASGKLVCFEVEGKRVVVEKPAPPPQATKGKGKKK